VRRQASRVTWSCATRHASRVTRHASRVTRHASPATRHPSPVTRHPSPATGPPVTATRHPSRVTTHTKHRTPSKDARQEIGGSPWGLPCNRNGQGCTHLLLFKCALGHELPVFSPRPPTQCAPPLPSCASCGPAAQHSPHVYVFLFFPPPLLFRPVIPDLPVLPFEHKNSTVQNNLTIPLPPTIPLLVGY